MIKDSFRQELTQYVSKFGKKDILFYDIECYKHDSFVVFLNIHKEEVAFFSNKTGFDGIPELMEDYLLCGYNNYYYDDYVLSAMVNQVSGDSNLRIKKVNDEIILNGETDVALNSHLKSVDCFQQVNTSRPSLKKVEANRGLSIEETPVDFNINRELTQEELDRAIYYCRYDVANTVDVFIDRFDSYFKPKMFILSLIDNPSDYILRHAYRWNTTTIAASVVKDGYSRATRTHSIQVPDDILSMVRSDVIDMWNTQEKGKITIEDFGNKIEFGFGGLHSVHTSQREFTKVMAADFESLYPNIMINYRLLGDSTAKFKEIVDRRVETKAKVAELKRLDKRTAEQDSLMKQLDDEQGALKLVINSIYGLLKNKYSSLYDPKISTTVCAIGQCLLYELGKRLSSCATISQLNTDGVYFVPHDDRWKEICDDYAAEVNIKLDYDEYEKVIQKDVNNYVAVTPDKRLYLKGGDTNMYFKPLIYQTVTARICQIALVEYLVNGTDPLDTILSKRDDPTLYQYVLQAGGTYIGTFDEHDVEYQKVNRIFATNIPNSVTLKKKRQDGGLVSYANAPDKMYVWNKDVQEMTHFKDILDVGHYHKITNNMIKLWERE